MHEFSSISVSSYDAGSLSDRLTEQSREGWSVVAIVPTASSVTAYLSREVGAGTDAESDDQAAASGDEAATVVTAHQPDVDDAGAADAGSDDAAPAAEPATTGHDADHHADHHDAEQDDAGTTSIDSERAGEDAPGWAAGASSSDPSTTEGDDAPAAAPATNDGGAHAAGSIEEAAAALGGSDHITPEPAGAGDDSAITLPGSGAAAPGSIEEAAAALPEVGGGQDTATSTTAAADTATETATTDAAASAASAAPAGWYADPSSRFELRYWDGSQWTEHVSRAGQQYTDPPVA